MVERKGSKIAQRFFMFRVITLSCACFVVGAIVLLFIAKAEEEVVGRGRVEPYCSEDVRAPHTGVLREVLCEPGDVVAKGQPLARFDRTKSLAQLAQLRDELRKVDAELALSRMKLERTKKDALPEKLRSTEMEMRKTKAAVALAEAELKRREKLFKSGLISASELDQARAAFESRQADLGVVGQKEQIVKSGLSQAIVREAEAGMKVIEERIGGIRREIERVEKELERMTVKAPVAGRIVLLPKEAGESVAPGELICRIAHGSTRKVVAFVDEQNVHKVAVGQPVHVYSSMYSYRKFGLCEGKVEEISTWSEERNGKQFFEVEIAIEKAPYELRFGSTATAHIVVDRRSIIGLLLCGR